MNKSIYFIGLCLLAGAIDGVAAPRELEELSVYQKKETILGKQFVYREDMAAGTRKETWTVDGRQVTSKEYEEAILEAEKELRKEERRAELEHRRVHQEWQLIASLELNKKLLRLTIERVEAALKRCGDQRLVPFVQFNAQSGLSRDQFNDIQEVLAAAKKLLDMNNDDSLGLIRAAIEKLELLPDRLDGLIQVSINHAIKNCDDTKVLKELLGLLPSA